jgi:hypothetical protein
MFHPVLDPVHHEGSKLTSIVSLAAVATCKIFFVPRTLVSQPSVRRALANQAGDIGGIAVAEKVDVKVVSDPSAQNSAEASMVIRTDRIANLPNNERDFASLLFSRPSLDRITTLARSTEWIVG